MSNPRAVAGQGQLKHGLRDFWERGSCGEVYAKGPSASDALEAQARERYRLEPYIHGFARFQEASSRDVLEIGVGMGADHLEWAKAGPRSLTGIDLTQRAIDHTRLRLGSHGLTSELRVADAERLPFANGSFDIVYSWGVIQHTPDTHRAVQEIHRVLRPGGTARVMIYNIYSMVAYMLWLRYALLSGHPRYTLSDVCADHLQGPGKKAYSINEASRMFRSFSRAEVRPQLSFGDLLNGAVGQRHRGALLTAARAVWPRWLIKTALRRHGLYLLIEAAK